MRRASIASSLVLAACTLGDLDGLSGGAVTAPSDAGADGSLPAAQADASTATTDGGSCTPVANGLLGHWTLDAADVQGRKVVDRSAAGNDGAIVGALPTSGPGHAGDALVFPKSGGAHITFDSLALGGGSGVTTISLWMLRAGNDIDDAVVSLPWDGDRFDLWWTDGGDQLCFNTGNNECWGITDTGLRDRWVHVVALFHDGAETASELYVDGVKRTLACVTSPQYGCDYIRAAAAPFVLGGVDGYFFHGTLDDVRVYDRALTDAEVATLFAGAACP